MSLARGSCVVIAFLLASCASASPHFYTLVPESGRNPSGAVVAGYRLVVDPVRIPAQVDRMELVIRLPDGGITVADGNRWIAPVADELQNALSIELLHRLGDAAFVAAKAASLSVQLNVERFESSPNQYALIEASWHLELKEAPKDLKVVCRTRAYEPVSGGGYPEIVRGYRRAVALIAGQIAAVAQESVGREVAQCPVSGQGSSSSVERPTATRAPAAWWRSQN
jgi:uncharacterized protein